MPLRHCLLLSIAYSLPSYPGLWTALFERLGGTTIKTPFLELAFAESSRKLQPFTVAAQHEAAATGIARPNDSLEAVNWLATGVASPNNSYLQRDTKYIKFVDGSGTSNIAKVILEDTDKILRPVQFLVSCLQSYVAIIPDSKLLLINTNPATMAMLRIHHEAMKSLELGYPESEKSGSFPKPQWEDLTTSVSKVFEVIHSDFKNDNDLLQICDPQYIKGLTLPSLKYGLYYLQPYLTIATADLLWAHGSRDEAVLILAEWVDAWNCARGTAGDSEPNCKVKANDAAKRLPAWFGYRAEFELSAFAYEVAGPDNPNYHAFLSDFAKRFGEYLSRGAHSVTLAAARKACTEGKGNLFPSAEADDGIGKNLIALLIENQDSVNVSQRSFITDKQIPEINHILGNSRLVLGFLPECLPATKVADFWPKDQAEKRINVGYLELAAAARAERIVRSGDDRRWVTDIRKQARADIEMGLEGLVTDDSPKPTKYGLSVSLFKGSREKEVYMKAFRALDQLNDAER